jgi:hypothetical protein
MPKGMSWVEWLAGGLIVAAGVIFLLGSGDGIASKDPLTQVAAVVWGVLCAGLGLSLFLIRPLLCLGPHAPLWLIPACGAGLFFGRDSVCRALYVGDSLSRVTCIIEIQDIAPVCIIFGTILLIRRHQVFRRTN